jgi:hypothetical protein
MGSQVSFFLAPSDLRTLKAAFSKAGDLVYIGSDPRLISLHEVTEIVPQYGVEDLHLMIARKCDYQGVLRYHESRGTQGIFDITLHQPVIELDRPFVSQGFIRSGRLYRQDSYWLMNGEEVRKPEEWILWAKRLFTKVRRSLTKFDDSFYYAGEEALAMRANGVLFQEIDDPRNELCG